MKIANLPIGALLAAGALFFLGRVAFAAIIAGNASITDGIYLIVGGVLMILSAIFAESAVASSGVRAYVKAVGYEPPIVFGTLLSVVAILINAAAAANVPLAKGLMYALAGGILVAALYAKQLGVIQRPRTRR